MKKFSVLNKSLAALAVLAASGFAVAHAADSQSYTINLSATVPSDAFQVIPVDTGWISQTQDMGYDISTSKLQVFEKQFQYKSTSGAIQATLTGNLNTQGQPQLSNGTDVIPLKVTFNNQEVTNTPATVVEATDAQAGGRTSLKISQADDAALTVNGSFTGAVAMIFEPLVATNP